MAKQKVIISVSLNNQKACTKAISIAVGIDGVIQTELMKEKNQIAITGNDMDVVLLASQLRKAMKHAVVETVSVVEEKKEDKPKEEPAKSVWPHDPPLTYFYPQIPQPYFVYDHNHSYHANNDQSCSIM